jgi:hypothetical protein
VKASKRLRKAAGATAAVMVASNWAGLPTTSRNADAIVPLSDQILAQVSGGQSEETINFTCYSAAYWSAATRLAAAITEAAVPIAVPVAVVALCAGYKGEQVVVEPFYQSTFIDVYTGFLVMAGYIQNMTEVNGAFQCSPGDQNCNTPTFYSSVTENLDDYYCGYTDCWCDWDSDCFSYWCDNGYCVS